MEASGDGRREPGESKGKGSADAIFSADKKGMEGARKEETGRAQGR